VCFSIGGHDIEVLDSCWPHQDHIISNTRADKSDVSQRQRKFVDQVIIVFRWLSKLDCDTLFKSYCSDFCGCELV